MGIHGAFAGLVVGVADNFSALFGILIAIIAHKWAEAITVGISIAKARMAVSMNLILIFAFSMATPVGILVGMLFADSGDETKAVMNAISAGTFLYISAVEIFSEEFSGKSQKYYKFIASVAGILLMIGVWYLEKFTEPEEE